MSSSSDTATLARELVETGPSTSPGEVGSADRLSALEHWSFQVDSPFRPAAEIQLLAEAVTAEADEALGEATGDRSAESPGVFGEDLAQADESDEAYEAEDESPIQEADPLAETPSSEHPLAAVFSLPRLAFQAMSQGGWATAIAVAIGAGHRDVNKLTNMVFWFRHPQLIGQRLRPDQKDLAREWIEIRDRIVIPALAAGTGGSAAPAAQPAVPPPATPPPPATTGGGRTSISSSGLRWYGAPSQETPELLAFMRLVYEKHVQRSKAKGEPFVDTLPKDAIDEIDKGSGQYARKDAATQGRAMLAAARAALAAEGLAGQVRIGVLSGYRSADRQFEIWQGKGGGGKRGFPYYYAVTRAARIAAGGEHGERAAQHLAEHIAQWVAAPGYSNHQDGLALDLGVGAVGKSLGRLKASTKTKRSWFWDWLKKNAHTFDFEPYWKEAWHWVYKPKTGSSSEVLEGLEASRLGESWTAGGWASEASPTAIKAGELEVPRIPLLASHRGRQPDLILGWNDMPAAPAEIDVVVHLHGYSWATMTLPKHIKVWAGLDLAPVDGANGSGRSRPTLTVLPRGHFTGVQAGRIYRYTFPALITKDGLTTLVRESLERFGKHVGAAPPRVGRLILTAHSGGGAPLMHILRRHDPHEVHVFDGLYQDATPLAEWASRHIKADRGAGASGSASPGAMRVFFRPGTKVHSMRLLKAISSDLQGAPPTIQDRYRVEASTLGHFQIPRQYGWRILADPAADVPDALRPKAGAGTLPRLYESDATETTMAGEASDGADMGELLELELDEWEGEELAGIGLDATSEYEEEEAAAFGEAETDESEGVAELEEPALEEPELEEPEGIAEVTPQLLGSAPEMAPLATEVGESMAWPEPPRPETETVGAPVSAPIQGESEGEFETNELDQRRTTSWAIASVGGGGFVVGVSIFLLVNRETGREHTMWVTTGGFTTQLGVAAGGTPSYTMFETSRPVNFADLDGIGARVTTANIGVFLGYSIVYLTLWDGSAYLGKKLAYIRMGGWGAMIPGGSVAHGVTKILYGAGRRSGTVPLVIAPEADDTVHEPALSSIRMAAKESPRIALPNELLFDFDSAALKPAARPALMYLADLLNNRLQLPVEIEGHTDSTGRPKYNLDLSRRRAEAVKRWFIDRGVHGAKDFAVIPHGEDKPVGSNATPEGRSKNRRVVIKASWNL